MLSGILTKFKNERKLLISVSKHSLSIFKKIIIFYWVIPQLRPWIFKNQSNSSLNFAKYLFSPRIYKMPIKSVPPLSWSVNGGDV